MLFLAGSVLYLGLYNIWFDLRSRQGRHIFSFCQLWVFLISTQPSFLKNWSVDSQLNSDKFSFVHPWLDFWKYLSYFIPGMRSKHFGSRDFHRLQELCHCGKFSGLLYILQSLVFSPGYLSKCTLSTCLLRFLVSFVKNACQQKIFKMSIKWVSDFYVFKIPGGWGT